MGTNNAIGKGSLVLSANADSMLAGLSRAEAAAKKTKANLDKTFSDQFKGAFAGAFGGSALGGKIGGPLVETGLDALKSFGGHVTGITSHFQKLQDELDRTQRAADEMGKALDRSLARADERLGSITDRREKGGVIDSQISGITAQLEGQRAAAERARAELRELRDTSSSKSLDARFSFSLDAEIKKNEIALASADAAASKLSDRLADLRREKEKLADPSKDFGLVGDINRLTESLKLQADTWGMTGNQAQVFALRARGASSEMLKAAQEQADRLDELQKKANSSAAGNAAKLSGALERGGADAYSVVAKFQTGNVMAEDKAKRTERILEQSKVKLGEIAQKLTTAPVIKLI